MSSTPVMVHVGRAVTWGFALGTLGWIAWGVAQAVAGRTDILGTDPAETIVHLTGVTALQMLLATLLVGSMRDLRMWTPLLRLRRLLGLWSFAWAVLHLMAFAVFELEGDLAELGAVITEKPYVIAGALALALLIPLAITSTRGWRASLGRKWIVLHRLVYPAVVLACVHLLWQVRSDAGEALLYGAIAAFLLGSRVWFRVLQPALGSDSQGSR